MYNREKTKKLSCPEKIIAVTNRKLCDGDFLDQIKKITDLGVRALILREKDLSESEYEALAAQVLEICQDTDTICILHNFPSVAERLGCGYLHLPLPVFHDYRNYIEEIRKNDKADILAYSCLGNSSITKMELGTSVHSTEQAKEAIALGASYVTAGHIFSTQCKPGLAPRGIDFLKNICQTVQGPVFGIGGIHPDNMQQVLDAGVAGVCMMSEMMRL